MKKNIKQISLACIVGLILIIFTSCDDSSELFTISENPDAPVLADLNFTMLELDAVNTNNPAVTLNWQAANYGQPAGINYAIEFANDEEFTNPVVAATITGQTAITLSVNELNAAAGNAGLNPFEWATIYARVVSSLGTQNGETKDSNTIQFSVYPYYNYVFEDYFLVGDAMSSGWNNNNNNPALFRDENDSNLFHYTGFFIDNGHFKVLETKGLWQPQWGTNDGVIIEGNPGTGSDDPERFPYGGVNGIAAGFYTFKINFASNTFTFEPYTNAITASPASLTLQGTSTTNVAMSSLAQDGHIWYASAVRLTPGEISFLTDAGATWGGSTSFSGVATDGGGSVPVIVEDDYDVWFNDLTGRYILIPLNL
jgi:hypothetical protein